MPETFTHRTPLSSHSLANVNRPVKLLISPHAETVYMRLYKNDTLKARRVGSVVAVVSMSGSPT